MKNVNISIEKVKDGVIFLNIKKGNRTIHIERNLCTNYISGFVNKKIQFVIEYEEIEDAWKKAEEFMK